MEPIELDPDRVVLTAEQRARRPLLNDAELRRVAADIAEQGQAELAEVTKTREGYALVSGQCLLEAVKLLREGFKLHGREYAAKPGAKLRCVIVDASADPVELFVRTVLKDRARHGASPLRDAHDQATLQEFGMTKTEIAKRYGVTIGSVTKGGWLLQLHPKIQRKIDRGELGVNNGYAVHRLPHDTQLELIARHGDNLGDLQKAVARWLRDNGDGTTEPIQRTMRQLREKLQELSADPWREPVRSVAGALLAYARGEILDEELSERLKAIQGKPRAT